MKLQMKSGSKSKKDTHIDMEDGYVWKHHRMSVLAAIALGWFTSVGIACAVAGIIYWILNLID